MRHSTFQSVLDVRDRADFRDIVVRFTKRMGSDRVGAMMVLDHRDAPTEFVAVDNAPDGFRETIEDLRSARVDPVMQHCKHHHAPILWNQATYVKAGQIAAWEEQAQFGYRAGICLALHMPEGRHFVLGVDRDQALPVDRGELARTVSELQLFAVYAQEAAMRVLAPYQKKNIPRLTAHEIDVLRWTMEGKTVWEVGAILNLQESTVQMHIDNAAGKLACANAHQAVLKAMRLGLIR